LKNNKTLTFLEKIVGLPSIGNFQKSEFQRNAFTKGIKKYGITYEQQHLIYKGNQTK